MRSTATVTVTPTTTPPDLPDGWDAESLLGTGRTAHVWKIQDRGSGQSFALKAPAPHVDPVAATYRLHHETQIARTLDHPHLNTLVGTLSDEVTQTTVGSVWDVAEGGTLEDLITAHGALNLGQTLTVLEPLVDAVDYLHRRGIAHGDIAPGNVLLSVTGAPMLADLGSARSTGTTHPASSLPADGAGGGTPGFEAPELSHPERFTGLLPEADVYSLGALAWYMLTGGSIPGRSLSRVPLPMLVPSVPDSVVDIVEDCLQERPASRPTIEHLYRALGQWPSEPEPLDLYPSVGEGPAALRLVTRDPGISHRVGRRSRQARTASTWARASAPVKKKALRRARLGVIAGACGLALMIVPLPDIMAPESTDFVQVLDELAESRSEAIRNRAAEQVNGYAVPGSEVHEKDRELIDSLASQGLSAEGLQMSVVLTTLSVPAVEDVADAVELPVQWRWDAVPLVDEHGQATGGTLEGSTTDVVVELVRGDQVGSGEPWLIEAVRAVEPAD